MVLPLTQSEPPAACPDRGAVGLVSGTLVRTLDGLIPVDFLGEGDRVVCRQGARRLMAVTAGLQDRIALIRIRASVLGHGRPEQDLLVAPGQPVLIRDWRAMALYGVKVATVPAMRLVDGENVVRETHAQARLYTLHFAEDEVIYAEGLELACPALAPANADQPA